MRHTIILLSLITILPNVVLPANHVGSLAKSEATSSAAISFTPASASKYIQKLIEQENLWRAGGDTMKVSLSRLLDQFYVPIDSAKKNLANFDFDGITTSLGTLTTRDTIPVRWLKDSTFIIDTIKLTRDPLITREIIVERPIEALAIDLTETILSPAGDESFTTDTILNIYIDTLLLQEYNIQLYQIVNSRIVPSIVPVGSSKMADFLPDWSKIVFSESFRAIVADEDSPFFILQSERMPDSLKTAVQTLLSYTHSRDSILVFINTSVGQASPFWLSTQAKNQERFWIRNALNDSITVWIGNPSKHNIAIALEDNVLIERRVKKSSDQLQFATLSPQHNIVRLEPLTEIPVFWDLGMTSSFTLNQTSHTNWARGGQNSMSGMLDLSGNANFKDEKGKRGWTNTARLRYGAIITEEHGYRTNTDIIELNSQYSRVLLDNLNLSASLYGRTQIAKGFNFPNDSVPVSKFLSPGTFTLGLGLDYTPFKDTRINFAPLSYRNTFVLDTTTIDQTRHGIASNKRARHEMGGQLVLRNSINLTEDLRMTNAVRLFSGYLQKPLNMDVDWEMSLDMQISWYFAIRLNMHLIYDEDIRFPVTDANNNPVLNPDGTPHRVPKTQLRQLLGLTLSLRI